MCGMLVQFDGGVAVHAENNGKKGGINDTITNMLSFAIARRVYTSLRNFARI
ncbi:hypothetical protein J23TS9_46200 [Paenibacillus sp. J23TS9]|nr:hypothetical protein J23TS9_46200 [Paenibacillus sp. J23TS9]